MPGERKPAVSGGCVLKKSGINVSGESYPRPTNQVSGKAGKLLLGSCSISLNQSLCRRWLLLGGFGRLAIVHREE